MMLNNELDIKNYYRFIEFASKMVGFEFPHERFKLLALDMYKAESKQELLVKSFADSYTYVINNKTQILTKSILKKAYYLLTDLMLEDEKCAKILEVYYQNYDETSHYLAALIHLAVLDNIKERKIEFAFIISNYVMLKKGRYSFVPYSQIFDDYFTAIGEKDLNKLMKVYASIESFSKKNLKNLNINRNELIEEIKKYRLELKNKFKIKKLYLYGSYAKDKTTYCSDIDFLIIFDEKLLNHERYILEGQIRDYLFNKIQIRIDLIDFTHALEKLDITEMENIMTII